MIDFVATWENHANLLKNSNFTKTGAGIRLNLVLQLIREGFLLKFNFIGYLEFI